MYDCHLHSELSHDSKAPMRDIVLSAITKGLGGVTFTEHIDIGFPLYTVEEYGPSPEELLTRYIEARDEFAPYPVLLGAEIGFEEDFAAERAEFISKLPLDLVISSVHSLYGLELFDKNTYQDRAKADFCFDYLKKLIRSLSDDNDFDVVGHIGFIAKRAPYSDPVLHMSDFPELSDELLRNVINKGRAIELNTSGMTSGKGTIPEMNFFRRYRELGGEIVTIGSDAHIPENVGTGFCDAAELLRECGFGYIAHYEKRKPVFEHI